MRHLLATMATTASLGSLAHAASIELKATVRDFLDTHPDMERTVGNDRNMVETTLGADGNPIYAGGPGGTATTSGQASFDQWYTDVLGVNQSMDIILELQDNDNDGVFTYSNSSFFPIDNQLMGNQGRPHNYHFTMELETAFTYQGGETFTFRGDDDVWVYINNERVIDLGGVHGAQTASVDLDMLGLTAGHDYPFKLFFAERHTTQSNFRIDTSMLLQATNPVPLPSAAALFLPALLGSAWASRRRSSQSKGDV
ncbi:MAG: fibro-slime domain-containing protein [Pseudomonadota bacterium]